MSTALRQEAQSLCQQADQLVDEAVATRENHVLIAEAAELYVQAASLDPELIGPYLGLAYLMIANGNLDTARGLLLQARELDAGHPEIAWFEQELSRLEINRVNFEAPAQAGSAPIQKLTSIRRLGQDAGANALRRPDLNETEPAALQFGTPAAIQFSAGDA